jgi:hypothetical protein
MILVAGCDVIQPPLHADGASATTTTVCGTVGEVVGTPVGNFRFVLVTVIKVGHCCMRCWSPLSPASIPALLVGRYLRREANITSDLSHFHWSASNLYPSLHLSMPSYLPAAIVPL